jgi:hypothetical protein
MLYNFATSEMQAENVAGGGTYNPGEWIYEETLTTPANYVSPGDKRINNSNNWFYYLSCK